MKKKNESAVESVRKSHRSLSNLLRLCLPVSLAIALIVAVSVVQGRWSHRWGGVGEAALHLASELQRVPHTIGDWQGVDQTQNSRELAAAGAAGHIARTYRNVRTGEHVSMYLICGQTRDISQHTPDRCYPAAGFSTLEAPQRYVMQADGKQTEFFTSMFRRESPEGIADVRVFWTWGHGGRWKAHEWPRKAYGGVQAIYKLYFLETITPENRELDSSVSDRFGREALPVLTEALFGPERD